MIYSIFHCCLINREREIVDIVETVQRWSNVGMSTPTFPPTINVGATLSLQSSNVFQSPKIVLYI